ncbi:helix-turn-helix domain-containing protein [Streptomyces verrucosisporus]|uniref:helix-turn-helix domain-containing protein n=1 Tax=Streptomyces verrucosisporus TaxID=1695161 RepID=UPI0019CFC687|nr:helix-turn-helix domain-containing protein [Streptomyces verrucosisporus]MBN3928804.1 helix-turn-helix domain-containing protein [Streptomyces verrucosisporus]
MHRGYRTRWPVLDEHRADPAYVEAGASIALGQAVYDRRTALGFTQGQLAHRAGMAEAEVERIEGGAVMPTVALLRALSRALDARVELSVEGDDTFLAFLPFAGHGSTARDRKSFRG